MLILNNFYNKNVQKYNKFYITHNFNLFRYHFADGDEVVIEEGQKWSLEKRSNKLSPTNSKVLYFFQLMHITPIMQEYFQTGVLDYS